MDVEVAFKAKRKKERKCKQTSCSPTLGLIFEIVLVKLLFKASKVQEQEEQPSNVTKEILYEKNNN